MTEFIEIIQQENDTQRAHIAALLGEMEKSRITGNRIDPEKMYSQMSKIGQRIDDLYSVSIHWPVLESIEH
jgi:hypothetical protein